MILTIDTSTPLRDLDREILRGLLGENTQPAATPAPAAEPTPEPKKAAAKKTKATEPKAETPTDGPSLQDAVDAAAKLVSAGKTAEVRAALNAVGARRVSEVAADSVQAFLDALTAAA